MAIEILPQIYSSGVFKLKGKLLQYLSEEMWYTCIAIRKIEEIEAVGIDCYQEYYVPIGLDETDFSNDNKVNACIITVKASNGDLKHFPSTYLASFPNGSGILYSVMGLAFDLGALPVSYDLTILEKKIKDVILNEIGVESRSRQLTMSNYEIISQGSHERIEAARKSKIHKSDNLIHLNKALIKENEDLKNRIKNLEKWVVDYLEDAKKIAREIKVAGFKLP